MTKKRIFRFLLINAVLLAMLLVVLEGVLRRADPPPPTHPQGGPPLAHLNRSTPGSLYITVGGRVKTNPEFLPRPDDPDLRGFTAIDLPHPKPAGVRRIVTVGSSPMRGGTQPGQSTADSLRYSLDRLTPDRRYQVIDASLPQGFADNVAWTIQQLAPLEPDLVILWPAAAPVIYADMERTLFADKNTRARILELLATSRTYSALREMLHTVTPGRAGPSAPPAQMREDPAVVDPELTAFLTRLNQAAGDAYAHFLETALATPHGHDARVLVLVPPTCLACVPPLFSVHDPRVSAEQAIRFAAHLRRGVADLEAGNLDRAIAELTKAKKIDPTYAKVRWHLGQTLRRAERPEQAREELAAAVKYDASVETIKEPPDAGTRSIAKRAGAELFDLEAFVVARMPDGIVDQRAMIDLTHLTLDLQQQFAQELAAQIDREWPSD